MYVLQLLNKFLLIIIIFKIDEIHSEEIPYNTVVCFGDSNSDMGNVYNMTSLRWPIVPPYYQGRFCNGPIWIEKLHISNVINYAYGSATSDNNLVQGITQFGFFVPGVRQQIDMYKNTTVLNTINFDHTIYIVWAGSNDYFFNLTLSPSQVVASLMHGINDLIRLGAKHILIVNQPPLEAYPAVAAFNMNAFLNLLTLAHNGNLSNSIQSLQSNFPQVSLKLLDVYSLVNNIYLNGLSYGINITKNCWTTLNNIVNQSCSTPDTYLFIDEYHFTTRIHQFIADDAKKLLATSNAIINSPYFFLLILSILISLDYC